MSVCGPSSFHYSRPLRESFRNSPILERNTVACLSILTTQLHVYSARAKFVDGVCRNVSHHASRLSISVAPLEESEDHRRAPRRSHRHISEIILRQPTDRRCHSAGLFVTQVHSKHRRAVEDSDVHGPRHHKSNNILGVSAGHLCRIGPCLTCC